LGGQPRDLDGAISGKGNIGVCRQILLQVQRGDGACLGKVSAGKKEGEFGAFQSAIDFIAKVKRH